MNIRAIVVVAAVLACSQPAYPSDTTWIQGSVTSVTKRPIRVAHVLLLDHPGAAVDAKGQFRLATTQKGRLLLRIVSPDHAPIERYVLCSGGHTIRLKAVAATHFIPRDVLDTVSIVVAGSTLALKRVGKGLYGADVVTTDTIVRYHVRSIVRGAPLPTFTSGTQNNDVAPDEKGIYWSTVRVADGIARILVNTKANPSSSEHSTLTFLSTDDATLDSLMARMELRGRPNTPPSAARRSTAKPSLTFARYAERSDRVREVAALAFGVSWDTLREMVPPTSMAWTIGQQMFFEMLMLADRNPDIWDYIDTLLLRHPVRRIIPPLRAAAVAYAQRAGMPDRSRRLLADMQREFPDLDRTQDVRRMTDPNRPIQVGRMLPDFDWSSTDATQRRVSSSMLLGKHTLFVVWNSFTENTAFFDELKRLQKMYMADIAVVSIFAGSGIQPTSLATSIQTHPWPTIYSDGTPQSPAVVLDNRPPFVLLVGPDRTIVMISGGLDAIELNKALARNIRK